MSKALFIAEKPSVAKEGFAKALKDNFRNFDGYMESDNYVVTWCVGHLVSMSYPEAYDEGLKKWRLDTIPFIPEEYKYEVIGAVTKQYKIVAALLTREDVDTIYVCTDSGREGEYIYRLVDQMVGVKGKNKKRVWIDSQTEEEVLRGIKEAKDLSEYDNLAASAYLRAKEDYLMGINFSRLLTLKYGWDMAQFLGEKSVSIAVGRVMTCVLGMVVRREREIRNFVKTPFYKVISNTVIGESEVKGEWRVWENSKYNDSPKLYSKSGFKTKEDATELINFLEEVKPVNATVYSIEKKNEKKNPPFLFNLADLQDLCTKLFKISPDETLKYIQELYEKKLVTYPRTDARVLSSAVAKEINKNLNGLKNIPGVKADVEEILSGDAWKKIGSTKYTDDKKITDHYAIIPTGQGFSAMGSLSELHVKIYEVIVRRFLAIFYPPAVYQKVSLVTDVRGEHFFTSFKLLSEEGFLKVTKYSFIKDKGKEKEEEKKGASEEEEDTEISDAGLLEKVAALKKGEVLTISGFEISEGETSPPKRYTTGSMVIAMEGAGKLIEDEELRAQIKGSGIGTSATRAEIVAKLIKINYISNNKKTQIITPTLKGEMIFDAVTASIKSLLNPELTASWEKGLTMVAEGSITEAEYMKKLDDFIRTRIDAVKKINNSKQLTPYYSYSAQFYKTGKEAKKTNKK